MAFKVKHRSSEEAFVSTRLRPAAHSQRRSPSRPCVPSPQPTAKASGSTTASITPPRRDSPGSAPSRPRIGSAPPRCQKHRPRPICRAAVTCRPDLLQQLTLQPMLRKPAQKSTQSTAAQHGHRIPGIGRPFPANPTAARTPEATVMARFLGSSPTESAACCVTMRRGISYVPHRRRLFEEQVSQRFSDAWKEETTPQGAESGPPRHATLWKNFPCTHFLNDTSMIVPQRATAATIILACYRRR